MYGTKAGVRKVSVKSAVGERRRGVLLWATRNNRRSSNLGAVPEAGSEQPRGPRSEWCNLLFLIVCYNCTTLLSLSQIISLLLSHFMIWGRG